VDGQPIEPALAKPALRHATHCCAPLGAGNTPSRAELLAHRAGAVHGNHLSAAAQISYDLDQPAPPAARNG
jgi:hypothetical protein